MTMMTTGKRSRPASALKTLFAGAAVSVAFGFVMSAQASHVVDSSDCTTNNWSSATGLTADDAGVQGGTNRRYGGPCGLRVATGGGEAFVTSEEPTNETSYNVRFYAFMDDAPAGGDVTLFATDAFSVMYHEASSEVMLHADHDGGIDTSLSFPVNAGWYSIHVNWTADAAADIEFLVANRDTPDGSAQTVNLDTSALSINTAMLGNVDDTGLDAGSLDFDDFVSTRITPPDRLLVGDANGDDSYSVGDLNSVLVELNENGFADGQPDCNEEGSMSVGDLNCALVILNNL